ncbi:hypothetical protein CGSMWGv00703C2mash_03910 [Gardnerella pickettii 00703C2mash]|nr:hypothetical protein CGSMWGv00703C2mash_03910 [Gardnerella pickettii 00703C2mash]
MQVGSLLPNSAKLANIWKSTSSHSTLSNSTHLASNLAY